MDGLRDQLAKIYEEKGSNYLKNVWEARNDYIAVILNRSRETIEAFFEKHAKHKLNQEETVICLRILEMQRNAMLMYTSCGWFFTEISGIETVQILQYAGRALQFVNLVSSNSLEEEFLSRLAEAKSNVRSLKDGRGVYEKLVKPHIASLHHIVAHYGIGSMFEGYYPESDQFELYCFKIHVFHQRKDSSGNMMLNFGRVHITSAVTLHEYDLIFIVVQIGLYDFRCSIKPFLDAQNMEDIEKDLFEGLHRHHIVDLLRKIDGYFGETYYSLKDLLLVDRLKIISLLTREMIEKISTVYEHLYDENQKMSEIYRSVNLSIPEEIRYAAKHTLERRIYAAVQDLASEGFQQKKTAAIYRLIEAAKSFEVEIRKEEIAKFLNREFKSRAKKLMNCIALETIEECYQIQRIAKRIGVELEHRETQEYFFLLMKRWVTDPQTLPDMLKNSENHLLQVMAELHLHTDELKKLLHKASPISSS